MANAYISSGRMDGVRSCIRGPVMALVDLWLRALKSEFGLAITTDNRMLLRQHLYRARAESGNADLDQLVMVLPEEPDQIWLVRRENSLGANHQGHVEPL